MIDVIYPPSPQDFHRLVESNESLEAEVQSLRDEIIALKIERDALHDRYEFILEKLEYYRYFDV